MEGIEFRKALLSNLPFLLNLRLETMEEHLVNEGILLTTEDHESRILQRFEDAQIILYNGQKVGLLKLISKDGNYKLMQLQIRKSCQGNGLGSTVLKILIQRANRIKVTIELSVLRGNRAISLYQKMGFVIVGEKKHSLFMKKSFDEY